MTVYDLINRPINCSCGRTHFCAIPHLRIGEGVLSELPEATADYHHILLVADKNTYPLCGERVRSLLSSHVSAVCLFDSPEQLGSDERVVPNENSIAYIRSFLTEDTDFILGIGSGVINDLCKYVSYYRNIPSGIIATAPSMDGFASSGAAMILRGMKVTDTTHAPELIFGDVDILKNAPMDMIRSGYADIIGKYSALNDWKLSALVNGEYLCPMVYQTVKDSTDELRAKAGDLSRRDPAAIGRLMDILVLVGVCLTLLSTTRPGSGSEHHLSHYFEITGLIHRQPYFLHGTDVGYATIVTAALREKLRQVKDPVFHTLSRETRLACYRKIYGSFADEVAAIQDKAGRYNAPKADFYRANWSSVCAILAECPTAREIGVMLTDVGFDLSAFEALYGREKIENGIRFGKDLKDRYSVLWLYSEMFLTEEEAKSIL